MDARIREMTPDDCEAVARVRVRGWQSAYAGLMPQSYLDAMSVKKDAARRREVLAEGRARTTDLVAERDGEVVGWGCCGPSRDEDATGEQCELYAIYVLEEQLSTGVGRALMTELTGRAVADGFAGMLLWVLKENDRARRFYEKAGFAPDGAEEPFEVDGVAVPEVRYARALTP
ncbi:GNAT family N-acetyltransferase [Streptomyces lunaelactis]|uniref:GNAT family N-acetyltransferase n=3 Tax=Streptomyces lunaelactis TaxID=1535768 RepID=UPI001584833D|nr:GNAT family N-acetyltransferase [Streptomyces lunaelactis]NUK57682.1 GNAT family N-acetyltransferase [Streptomyces lunaelactis]NUK64151.1 GNAT family N-acetyltransferase [Streptomyces lunaelactis]NUL30147.1 GNAT family N-acetyltransferase [Streptomyces lunaelactis]